MKRTKLLPDDDPIELSPSTLKVEIVVSPTISPVTVRRL